MFIRQPAFSRNGSFLKGALHCHTTRSDGVGDPGDVIRMHYEHGYDFMALTDHNIFNRINYADVPMTGRTACTLSAWGILLTPMDLRRMKSSLSTAALRTRRAHRA